ncbi:hypothetical protein K438DRAFT_1757930 [Mycena galopus ATCC 62051]|nr:hypothetical protein K438DRAFT_1757930 [Mycena galopus ATCC 62051]
MHPMQTVAEQQYELQNRFHEGITPHPSSEFIHMQICLRAASSVGIVLPRNARSKRGAMPSQVCCECRARALLLAAFGRGPQSQALNELKGRDRQGFQELRVQRVRDMETSARRKGNLKHRGVKKVLSRKISKNLCVVPQVQNYLVQNERPKELGDVAVRSRAKTHGLIPCGQMKETKIVFLLRFGPCCGGGGITVPRINYKEGQSKSGGLQYSLENVVEDHWTSYGKGPKETSQSVFNIVLSLIAKFMGICARTNSIRQGLPRLRCVMAAMRLGATGNTKPGIIGDSAVESSEQEETEVKDSLQSRRVYK